jgi:selenocysteine lyase/cysteine desulfurase
MFDTSESIFPAKKNRIFMAHCAISPLFAEAATAKQEFSADMAAGGISALPKYFDLIPRFHRNAAQFLRTSPENISYVHNVAEALCMIANGYPFSPGDEVISYLHEYPSNHYPWLLQQKRGVALELLSDNVPLHENADFSHPTGWSMDELESRITKRTRIIALSHVQFTSGFAADLQRLGELCRHKKVDLVVDCAQSLGCLPVYPEEFNISAMVASGWKWLMGPMGSGLCYTSPEFREKLTETMAGPSLMRQGLDYLDLSWAPHDDGRKFEYSTLPWDHVAAMNAVLENLFLKYSMEDIRDEVFRLQDLLLKNIVPGNLRFFDFPTANRSGILAAEPADVPAADIVDKMRDKGVIVSAPIGLLRCAPHFYNDDNQMETAAEYLNEFFAGYSA